jgi:hypothetical protein
MMKIWIIERGEYSDYRVMGIFSTREKAEQMLAVVNGSEDDDSYYKATIAERELDPCVDKINAGLKAYEITMNYNGDTERITPILLYDLSDGLQVWKRTQAMAWNGKPIADAICGTVWATDEKHAVKIANEFRSRMIAENKMTIREV